MLHGRRRPLLRASITRSGLGSCRDLHICLSHCSGSSSGAFFCLEELSVLYCVIRMHIAYFALRYAVLCCLKFGHELDVFIALFQAGGSGV